MKKNYTHMFVQIDTDKLILGNYLINLSEGEKQPNPAFPATPLVKSCTTICSKGALSKGSPVKDFIIDVSPKETVHFTLLPSDLMTHHGLYINGFKNPHPPKGKKSKNPKSPFSEPQIGNHGISFSVEVKKISKKEELFDFNIWATLEYIDIYHKEQKLILCIDPRIRVIQSGGH